LAVTLRAADALLAVTSAACAAAARAASSADGVLARENPARERSEATSCEIFVMVF
jgi:hypothetical protein